ncbi:MAG: LuxR C-terminal-related transcriptional regulator [Rhizobiaceae bacterium]
MRDLNMSGATAGQDHRNPFGAPSPAGEPHHTLTMPDAARRGRWIAVDLNASDFALYFATPAADRGRLVACVDSAYPGLSPRTRSVASHISEVAVPHLRIATTVLWWCDDPESPFRATMRALSLLATEIVGPPGQAGLAFPVHADRGQFGLVTFGGDGIALDERLLCDTHGRCYALFSAVTALRPLESGRPPSISRRELECLKLTANGLTSEQIASQLGLSVHTANQYLTNTAQKLDAVNRMHAVAKALRMGLID